MKSCARITAIALLSSALGGCLSVSPSGHGTIVGGSGGLRFGGGIGVHLSEASEKKELPPEPEQPNNADSVEVPEESGENETGQ